MNLSYIKAKTTYYYLKLCNNEKTLLKSIETQSSFDLKQQLERLNTISFSLAIKRTVVFASLNVMTMLGLIAQLSFEEVINREQQIFRNPVSVFLQASPTFGDIDNDGDLDILIGEIRGLIELYSNNNGAFEINRSEENPFHFITFNTISKSIKPTFADFDNDGDSDIIIRKTKDSLAYFENNQGDFKEIKGMQNPFSVVNNPSMFSNEIGESFAFVDIDQDNDLDFVIDTGTLSSGLDLYINDNGTLTRQRDTENPFLNIPSDRIDKPTIDFIDFDNDDDYELVMGGSDGLLSYYDNDSNIFTLLEGDQNPFAHINVTSSSDPTFVDLDEDGDLDLVVGDFNGELHYYINTDNSFTKVPDDKSPFSGIFNRLLSVPEIVDFDHDNDLDIVFGNTDDITDSISIQVYSNENGIYQELTGDKNPFSFINLKGEYPVPSVIDFNNDGNLDLILSYVTGDSIETDSFTIDYFLNDGTQFIKQSVENNPFSQLVDETFAIPSFVDLDDDNDWDLIISDSFENTKIFSNIDDNLVLQNGNESIINEIISNTSNLYSVNLIDLDGDGDQDLVTGQRDFQIISYYPNNNGSFIESKDNPTTFDLAFVREGFPVLGFIDLDNDNDIDILSGAFFRGVIEFENTSSLISSIFDTENEETLSIFPNPASTVIHTEVGLLTIFNSQGQLIIEIPSNGLVDISFLENGIYIISQNGKHQRITINK